MQLAQKFISQRTATLTTREEIGHFRRMIDEYDDPELTLMLRSRLDRAIRHQNADTSEADYHLVAQGSIQDVARVLHNRVGGPPLQGKLRSRMQIGGVTETRIEGHIVTRTPIAGAEHMAKKRYVYYLFSNLA